MAKSTNPFTFQGFDATTELFKGAGKRNAGRQLQNQMQREADAASRQSSKGQGNVGQFLKQVARVSGKAPEAMVRITGTAKGSRHVSEHLAYITRNGKMEATNERGEVIEGREAVKEFADEWMIGSPKKAPDTRNIMLSMPAGTDPDKVLRAAKTFADKEFGGERMYLLVLHTSEIDEQTKGGHPHVHLTVKTRGFDGKNLNPRKADLQAWREGFAHELRELGVAAEATPRRSRGVVQKGTRQPVFHMERDAKAGKTTRRPEVQLRKYEEAIKEFKGVDKPKARPWEAKIAERQEKVRSAWLDTADVLGKHADPAARALAKQIREFVADMPPVQTEAQRMRSQVSSGLDRGRGR